MAMTDQSKRFPSILPFPDPGIDPGHLNDPAPDGPANEIPVRQNRQSQQIMGCRWIEGDLDQPNRRYCQKSRLVNRSYCPEHHARSINPHGDHRYTAEAAECDLYLQDPPPPEDGLEDGPNDGPDDGTSGEFGIARHDETSKERSGA
jgi:hypothetical protein